MITTFRRAMSGDLVFWDDAHSGEQCVVPCWPYDASGDAVDCEEDVVLVGVLGEDGLFRAEEAPAFDPREVAWICGREGEHGHRSNPPRHRGRQTG